LIDRNYARIVIKVNSGIK